MIAPSPGVAACAAVLMLISTAFVIVVIDQEPSAAKESKDGLVPHTKLTKAQDAAAIAAGKEVVDDEAKEAARSKLKKQQAKSGLVNAVTHDAEEKAGAEQKTYNPKNYNPQNYFKDASSFLGSKNYGANCLALKAYSVTLEDADLCSACTAKHDCSDKNFGNQALGVLSKIVKEMRTKPDKDNTARTCAAKLNKIIKDISQDKDLEADGIAMKMLGFMHYQMVHHRGLLVWGKLPDRAAGCKCASAERLACVNHVKRHGHAQYVYFDGPRVGFRGTVPIFSKMAVKSADLMVTASQMLKDTEHGTGAMSMHLKEAGEDKFSLADYKRIKNWDGKLA
jgi:hypothetical protein